MTYPLGANLSETPLCSKEPRRVRLVLLQIILDNAELLTLPDGKKMMPDVDARSSFDDGGSSIKRTKKRRLRLGTDGEDESEPEVVKFSQSSVRRRSGVVGHQAFEDPENFFRKK